MTTDLQSMAEKVRDFISRSGGMEPPGAEASFNKLALDLFALQFEQNAVYRRICEARGVAPESVEDWSRIPAVPAAAFKEYELTCLTPADRTAVFHSSGTTGQRPGRHFHSAESLALYEASLWPWFRLHVIPDLDQGNWRIAILTPLPAASPNSSLVHMFSTVRQKCGRETNLARRPVAG